MKKLSIALIILIAFLQTYIMVFEMFFWEARGPKIFSSIPLDLFAQTTQMAANQGLYNGFIAAGLIWSLFIADPVWKKSRFVFFGICACCRSLWCFHRRAESFIRTSYSCCTGHS